MPEFIVEYVVTQVRVMRVRAESAEQAKREVYDWHEQYSSDKVYESVIIQRIEKDE